MVYEIETKYTSISQILHFLELWHMRYRIYWHIVPPHVARVRQMPSLRGGTIQKGVLYARFLGQCLVIIIH
jgi:hypothetical protein